MRRSEKAERKGAGEIGIERERERWRDRERGKREKRD